MPIIGRSDNRSYPGFNSVELESIAQLNCGVWTPYHSKSVIAESGAGVGDSAVCDFSFRVNLTQFMLDRRTVRISLLFSL